MSTLQVANLHFESTANNRIQNINSTAFAIVAGGANAIIVNSTSAAIVGGIVANGSVGTAGQVLLSGGAGANAYWGGSAGYVMLSYTSNTTWTKPANLKAVKVTVVGGGGGGASATSPDNTSSGGGGGGSAISYIPEASIPGPVVVTVGLGGTGQATPTPAVATAGGTSSFGAFLSATGGAVGTRGVSATGVAGGAGGAGSGGTTNLTGGAGGTSLAPSIAGGYGGSSLLGAISSHSSIKGSAGVNGANYGGGGGGAFAGPTTSFAGGNGASGIVLVEEFY